MTRKEQIIAASIDFNEKIGKLRVIGGSNILSEEEYIALNYTHGASLEKAKWTGYRMKKE